MPLTDVKVAEFMGQTNENLRSLSNNIVSLAHELDRRFKEQGERIGSIEERIRALEINGKNGRKAIYKYSGVAGGGAILMELLHQVFHTLVSG